jgi:hypothetical protein
VTDAVQHVDTSRGVLEVMFGVNEWILVRVGGEERQAQVGSAGDLAALLLSLGLPAEEAQAHAWWLWERQPEDMESRISSSGQWGRDRGWRWLLELISFGWIR